MLGEEGYPGNEALMRREGRVREEFNAKDKARGIHKGSLFLLPTGFCKSTCYTSLPIECLTASYDAVSM